MWFDLFGGTDWWSLLRCRNSFGSISKYVNSFKGPAQSFESNRDACCIISERKLLMIDLMFRMRSPQLIVSVYATRHISLQPIYAIHLMCKLSSRMISFTLRVFLQVRLYRNSPHGRAPQNATTAPIIFHQCKKAYLARYFASVVDD